MATRAPIKSVNKSATAIATNAAAEKARKAASKRALAKALKEQNDATYGGPLHPETKAPEAAPAPKVDHKAQDAANALEAMRIDFAAISSLDPKSDQAATEFVKFLADQGFNPDGTVLTNPGVAKGAKYNGPMLALRTAAKSYVKGANGNPHCNDALATVLDGLTREQVISVLIKAMKLEGNPYLSLNPGQQSMNLRNKARGQLKNGFIKTEDIVAVIERESRHA